MEIRAIGIDLGKSIFHLSAVDARGQVVLRKKFSRLQLLRYTSTLHPCLIGMEAGAGAHHLGRRLRAQGHDVRLMPAQYVRPYVRSSNKNDSLDADGIVEAVTRPTMRFVPLKTAEQLDLQAFHRVRDRLVARRTSVINQLRALLFEDADNDLSARMRALLQGLRDEWKTLEIEIAKVEKQIERLAADDDACQRLIEIPGVGPLVATALVAAVGNASSFAKGRDLAA